MADVQDVQELKVQSPSEIPSEMAAQTKFTDYAFRETIIEDIQAAGYEYPTPIQAATIPASLEGKDIIGLAQTGTGKTAAFCLPIIHKLAQCTDLAALVLTPTRELAMQVTGVFNTLGKSSGIRVATIVGGIPMDNDYKALRSWPNILVATPGRLIDHLTYGSISLKEIQVLVVDEADRMHDMGFIPQIRRILDELPPTRQTMMFTATMPKDVERIARMSMKDPVRIQVGMQVPVQGAKQQLFRVSDEEKGSLLMRLISESEGKRVLVFVRTKRGCDKLHRIVSRRFQAARIHGDREQCERDDAMNGFREGRYRLLIATDIAARGIDVADIEHVINYDFPLSAEDYVHRIGRTARQQATGIATSFVTPNDRRFLLDAYKLLGDKLPLTDDLKDMLGHRSRHPRGDSRNGNGHSRSHNSSRDHGRARDDSHPAVDAQPDAEVVRHHRPEAGPSNGSPAGSNGEGLRSRRSRGRGRNRNAAGVPSQPQVVAERRPHESHAGRRSEPQVAAAPQPQPPVAQEARAPQRPETRREAPAERRSESRTESHSQPRPQTRKPASRRRDDDNEGHVVILDRCPDGPDCVVGEEERRRPRRRSDRPVRRRASKPRSGAKSEPSVDAQEAAQ